MSTSALIVMVVMLGLFWGGFLSLLVVALRRPTAPEDDEEREAPTSPSDPPAT